MGQQLLAGPSRAADHAAEVLGPEGGILVGEHIVSAGVRGGIPAQHADESVAAPEFRTDEIAVRAEGFAQRRRSEP